MARGGARRGGSLQQIAIAWRIGNRMLGNVTQGKGQGKMKYIQRDDPAPPTGREKEGIPPPL